MSDDMKNLRMLRFSDLKAAGIVPNRTTLARWLKLDVDPFPQPIRLAEKTRVWRKTAVEAWIERRASAGELAGVSAGNG